VTTRTPGFLPRPSTVRTSLLNIVAPRRARLLVGDDDRTLNNCAHLAPRVPYTTCTRLPATCPWLYLTGLHQSSPSRVTVYLTFDQVILHVATLHHTTFSPHIRSIITSAFGRTMYQINTSLYSPQITYTRTFHVASSR
jgi:hypothetical protein